MSHRAAGDEVLKQLAAVMKSRCRQGDHLARFGGEEIVLLMSARTADDLMRFGQRLVESCAAYDFKTAEHDATPVTISRGLHIVDDSGADLEPSFRIADKALYDAKK